MAGASRKAGTLLDLSTNPSLPPALSYLNRRDQRAARLLRQQIKLAGLERHLEALGLRAEAVVIAYVVDELASIRVDLR